MCCCRENTQTALAQGLGGQHIDAVGKGRRMLSGDSVTFPQTESHDSPLTPFSGPLVLGIRISSFTQADLASGNVQYIHSSEAEKHSDAFSFTLSNGVHEVGEGLASLLDGHRCSVIAFSWRARSHHCWESFVSLCSQPGTEAKRTLSCQREPTSGSLVGQSCRERWERECRGRLPSPRVGAGDRWPTRTFPPCRWRRLSASLFALWMTRCPKCRTSGCGYRRVWGRPSRSLSLKRRMQTQRSECYPGLWSNEMPVALLQYIPGVGRGVGLRVIQHPWKIKNQNIKKIKSKTRTYHGLLEKKS